MSLTVVVYCASSNQVAPVYFDAVERVANHLVDNQATVVYGGGGIGLMGRLADTVLTRKGHIIRIMPEFMRQVEWAHKGVSEFQFVEDMHERKKRFLLGVDAVVTLPGGCGTFEELMEAITLKRLGQFTKPIIIVNINRFYDSLITLLERSIEERFMAPEHRQLWTIVEEPEQIIDAIRQTPDWDPQAIHFATLT